MLNLVPVIALDAGSLLFENPTRVLHSACAAIEHSNRKSPELKILDNSHGCFQGQLRADRSNLRVSDQFRYE